MDPDPPSSTPRKVKFAPKGPPRRTPKPVTKIEAAAEDIDDDGESRQALSRKVNEHLTRRGRKSEKKSPAQVTFSHGITSTALRSFGKQREKNDDASNAADLKQSPSDETEIVDENLADLASALTAKKKRGYKEPWDYQNSYYPTTLPLRRPYSGDPELLDRQEFDEALDYDENTLSSASDLGLLDHDDKPRMIFFRFPPNLPVSGRPISGVRTETPDNLTTLERSANQKQTVGSSVPSVSSKGKDVAGSSSRVSGFSTGLKGKEIAGSASNLVHGYPSKKGCSLEELPQGYMGKMLVYKSGAVKLKLGDILYDVSPGSACVCPQSVVAINTSEKHCCEIGELNKHAVVSPDIDSLIDNVINLE